MNLFLGLKGHTNQESLPLRFGFQITETHQKFCHLKDALYDAASFDCNKATTETEIAFCSDPELSALHV